MPDLTIHQMTFHSGLHVGGPRDNPAESLGILPADTLFAALLDAWRRTGRDPVTFAAPFVAQPPTPPFLLTSTFPFAGGVRFYPMPADRSMLFSRTTLETYGKTLRGIAYLSEALFLRALQGELMDDWVFPTDPRQEPEYGAALQGGRYWLSVAEIGALPSALQRDKGKRHALVNLAIDATTRTPRVTLDRVSSASQIYHVGRTVFGEGCGLWFGVDWRDPERTIRDSGLTYRAALVQLLTLLGEDGVGGDRASGYGAFTHTSAAQIVALPDVGTGRMAWLLSRYHPSSRAERAALSHAAYSLVTVGGRLRSPDQAAQRRRKLILLAEGSQIPLTSLPAGDVTDVRPVYGPDVPAFPHPVYRYGLALAAGRKEAAHA